jgi:polysaccharide pyruvyl transferase WcaK-like protein
MSTGASQITKVGLNFREFKAKHFSDNTIRIYRDSILTLLHRIPESVELVFYSFCNEPHQSDLEMYNKIITDVGPQNVKIRNFEYENLSALKDDISTCNVFVGTRFHSVLLAVQAGVPTIGLSYEQKTVNFMNDAGIGDYALDIGTIKNEDISRTWDKLIMNNSQYEVQLKGIAKDHRILSLKHFEEISLVLCPRR